MPFISRTFQYLFIVPSVPSEPCDVPVCGVSHLFVIAIDRNVSQLPILAKQSMPTLGDLNNSDVGCIAFPLLVSPAFIHPATGGTGLEGPGGSHSHG